MNTESLRRSRRDDNHQEEAAQDLRSRFFETVPSLQWYQDLLGAEPYPYTGQIRA